MMVIENKFELGETVYLKTDNDQLARLVTQIAIGANGGLRYAVGCGTAETWHYEIEITNEKTFAIG